MKRVTIREVAEYTKLSPSTISNVLNGKQGKASPETVQKVWTAIKELGFEPNFVARSLVLQRTNTIGVIMRDISSPLYSLGVRCVEDACAQHGYGVIVGNTDAQMEREAALFQIYARKQLAGVIVISASGHVKDDHVCKWNSAFPVVLINRYSDSAEFNKILFDHYHGACLAVEHLFKVGKRKIAHITGEIAASTARKALVERYEGYQAALASLGLEGSAELVRRGYMGQEGGYEATKDLLAQKVDFDAVFCAEDTLAIGCLRALFEAGLRVPTDVAVVGFDDSLLASHTIPRLSTIRIPMYEAGAMAAEKLINIMENRDDSPKTVVLPCELVVRESA